MPNREKQSLQKDDLSQAEKPKPYVLLALIEHGSRPAAYIIVGLFVLLFLFKIKDPLFKLLEGAQEVKVGSFELRLRASADQAGLSKEFSGLETLSDQQVQLFLVVGDKNKPQISYSAEEVTEENLKKLQEMGLLSEVKRQEDGKLFWAVSDKGHNLHQLIFKQVIKSIRGSTAT
ncbi:MAG TPA: hypothetical protein VGX92_07340 [Pyrinomonadaceae bacterium]|nr:hypothetical protein [Pyrinomonadaceae bacterium]